jgi:hypothetical protein
MEKRSYLTVTPAVVRKASLRVVAFKSSSICLVRTVVPGLLMMAWAACGDERRLALYGDAGSAYGSRSAASVRAAFCFRLVARKGALSGSAACDQEDDPRIGAGAWRDRPRSRARAPSEKQIACAGQRMNHGG